MKLHFIYKIGFLSRFGISAITLYPFVFFSGAKETVSQRLFRHELQHIYQAQRLGVIRFYVKYLKFYFLLRFKGCSHQKAYWENPFEIEARDNEITPLTKFEIDLIGINSV